jgi:hypothetical protein
VSSIPELGLTPDHDLGAVHTLPDFRAILESDPMTPADRETLAGQAEVMIDGLYAHMLPSTPARFRSTARTRTTW